MDRRGCEGTWFGIRGSWGSRGFSSWEKGRGQGWPDGEALEGGTRYELGRNDEMQVAARRGGWELPWRLPVTYGGAEEIRRLRGAAGLLLRTRLSWRATCAAARGSEVEVFRMAAYAKDVVLLATLQDATTWIGLMAGKMRQVFQEAGEQERRCWADVRDYLGSHWVQGRGEVKACRKRHVWNLGPVAATGRGRREVRQAQIRGRGEGGGEGVWRAVGVGGG